MINRACHAGNHAEAMKTFPAAIAKRERSPNPTE